MIKVPQRLEFLLAILLSGLAIGMPLSSKAAGVTIITHGLNSGTDGWITGMANQITNHSRFPGTNATCYKLSVSNISGSFVLTSTRVAGSAPLTTDSGEIIIKLDW